MGYWNPKGDHESMLNIIKVGIKEIHQETDKVFIDRFLRGRVSQKTYANFLTQLYYVYQAMEDELMRNQANPIIGPIYFPQELTRLPSIEQDLAYFYGSDWQDKIQVLETTQKYVQRIRDVGSEQPELLFAHAFSRYMGDLFGGQILKRKWRKLYNFPEDQGVLFYTFREIDSVPKFREFMEIRVNGLELNLEQKHMQLEETKRVFRYNTDLILEVLEVAKASPDGFLPPKVEVQTWEEELKELGSDEVGGCMFSGNKKGVCPVGQNKAQSCPFSNVTNSTIPKYGLLACATLAVVYPIVKKVLS